MARKKKPPEHANHERWLVSYADFMTLLFAFFVVMFASSQSDKAKAQQVSEAMSKAFDGRKMSILSLMLGGTLDDRGKGNAMLRGPGGANKAKEEAKDEKVAELLPSLQILSAELHKEIEEGRIQISMENRGLVVSFKQASLFPSGEDVIAADAYSSLEKVAAAIGKISNPVRLEGHTDSRPINTPRFHNNWDLSAARSIALLELFSTRYAVPVERMSVAGYADTAPLASNDTEAGRARNRRCDVVILNERGVVGEPPKPENVKPNPGTQIR